MNKQVFCLLTFCAACVPGAQDAPEAGLDPEVTTGETTQGMISLNGISLNGISLNGISLNGTSFSGASVANVSVSGTAANGTAVTAKPATGNPWTGATLVGSTWTATVAGADTAPTVKLRIDAATAGTAPNADLWFYTVSYQTQSGWSPVCGLDASNHPVQAVAVSGAWTASPNDDASYAASPSSFTLACRAKTIAKCVELGYKPAKGYAAQLASCVRMLRGDFCGTGTPMTVDGTTINLYDNVGVQADTQAWPAEAEWTADGAACVNSNNSARYELVLSRDPRCVKRLKSSTCGTRFTTGTLLIDELAPNTVR